MSRTDGTIKVNIGKDKTTLIRYEIQTVHKISVEQNEILQGIEASLNPT